MAEPEGTECIVAPTGPATIQDRIAAFTMLDGMTEATQAQKIMRLTLVGFNRNEVAAILQTTPQNVSQALYAERKKSQKLARPAKPSATTGAE